MELTLYNYLLTDSNSLYWQNIRELDIPKHLMQLNEKELILGTTNYSNEALDIDYDSISLSDATHFITNVRYDENTHNIFADIHFLKKEVYLKVKKLKLLPSAVVFGTCTSTEGSRIIVTSISRIATWNFIRREDHAYRENDLNDAKKFFELAV